MRLLLRRDIWRAFTWFSLVMLASTFVKNTRRMFKARVFVQSGFFSTESHDDFKPQSQAVPDSMKEVLNMIDKQVKDNKVMLYMKGTPAAPQCGFSMQVCWRLESIEKRKK